MNETKIILSLKVREKIEKVGKDGCLQINLPLVDVQLEKALELTLSNKVIRVMVYSNNNY